MGLDIGLTGEGLAWVLQGQEAVYREVTGLVRGVMDGANAAVLAFGQTGSGKAHTLAGTPQQPGINFRAMSQLFQCAPCRCHALLLTNPHIKHIPLPTMNARDQLCVTTHAITHHSSGPNGMS